MFRAMRRKKQELSGEKTLELLRRGTSGVLAVVGDEGYPYAVPLSYVYDEGRLYFHCAAVGHKLDAIAANDKVSFCVIGQDDVWPEKFTTRFRSAIAFGRARLLEGEEKRRALEILSDKYCPVDVSARNREIDGSFDRVRVICLEIEHLTGKEAIELVQEK